MRGAPERPKLSLIHGSAKAPPEDPARAAEQVLRLVEWQIVRRLDGLLQGDYRSMFLGHGLDLAEIRAYQYGDDVRLMDWNVTARTDQPHVRRYREEREITAWLLLDTSASTDFGTALMRKQDVAVHLAAALARILTGRGNRVGAILFSGGITRLIPPRTGRRQAREIVRQLLSAELTRESGPTRLAEVLERSGRIIPCRSLIFVCSDFIAEPGWEAPLRRLGARHELTAVWLGDRREEEMPDIGPVVLEDSETGEQLYVDTHSRAFRSRFQDLVEQRRSTLTATFAREGVNVLKLSTEDDVLRKLVEFAARRRHAPGSLTRISGGVR